MLWEAGLFLFTKTVSVLVELVRELVIINMQNKHEKLQLSQPHGNVNFDVIFNCNSQPFYKKITSDLFVQMICN